ncbi:MAG: D-2-hydroxyacid dehydrogenase [Spirochaetia bacterium]|nr:D-2-hydroxyacid dehydrogenase [Spirochaetia bacterium]
MAGKKVLVALDVEERHKKTLESAYPEGEFIYCGSKGYEPFLSQANIIIGDIKPAMLRQAVNLEWLQTPNAGVDPFTSNIDMIPENLILTCATGSYGLAISEYMLGCVLSLMKHLDRYRINQTKHLWKDEGHVTSIQGSTTLVVGMGDIGSDFGRKMHLLGSTVYGIRRHQAPKPDWAEAVYTMDALDDLLGRADIVALCLPKTPSTIHLMDMAKFRKMKKTAILVNIGRGAAIMTDDLCTALNQHIIAGAAVDVTDPEPLPPDHPLWDAENIIITPHTSGQNHLPETFERIIRLSARNLALYKEGKPLESQVDLKAGYRIYRG